MYYNGKNLCDLNHYKHKSNKS